MIRGSLLVTLLAASSLAHAATHCVEPSGAGGCFMTIQAAIDASASGDTIQVAAGTYNESLLVLGPKRLTISGAGPAATIVDAGNLDRVLLGGYREQLVVERMTLRNGITPVSPHNEHGGCVRTVGKLTLRDVVVRDCSALDDGGGVYVDPGGRLTIERSTITGSVAGSCGGGVGGLFYSVLTIIDSTIEGNSAGNGGGICSGGVRLKIANSTISGNVASNDGGGVYQENGQRKGSMNLVGGTIAGNSATNRGGGLWTDRLVARMRGTILADNTAPTGPDCYSVPFFGEPVQLTSRGYNLIEDDADCSMRAILPTDVIGADPMLGPLAANGGPTRTHALLAGSPAIDAGIPVVGSGFFACRAQDQRGFPRNGRCDIGAYEF